jgi:uncharacterized protein (UPF0332 family)
MADARDVFLAKAMDCLASAEAEVSPGRYDSAANRCYYACYQAAVAALIEVGVGPSRRDGQWSHQAVHAQFSGLLIKRRKKYPGDFRDVHSANLDLRSIGDYSGFRVTETEARRALRRTQEFVRVIQYTLGGSQ